MQTEKDVDNTHESRKTLQNNVFLNVVFVVFTKIHQYFSNDGVEREKR